MSVSPASPSEFAFELRLCAHLEERREGIVARQLGGSVADPGGRVLDVVCVEPGPEFDARVAITGETIPDVAIESAVGTGRATYWKDAFDCHPGRARRATDRACEIGFFERERRGGRDYVRQTARYPDWVGRIVGIENKPDLANPGDLEDQLRIDVGLGLLDEVILATESYVTGAHLNRLPEEVGVWRVHDAETGAPTIEVVRDPTPLDVEEPGIELLERHPGRTDVAVVSRGEKARARRRLAERAYGKGWRTYGVPACANCEPDGLRPPGTDDPDAARSDAPGPTLPHCTYEGGLVDAASDCGPACPGYEPLAEPPADANDLAAEREERSPWVADPGGPRRQSGLDRFL